jgi:hypothetical protein
MSDLESTHTEEAGDFVRPFVVTGGRTRSRVDGLRFETLVQATGLSGHDLRFETSRVHALCTDAIAIAELSAHLAIPTGTIKVIVGDLIQTGHVSVHRVVQTETSADIQLISRLIEGVKKL